MKILIEVNYLLPLLKLLLCLKNFTKVEIMELNTYLGQLDFQYFLQAHYIKELGVKIINSNLNKYFNSRIYVGFFEKLFITLKTFFIFNFKY